MRLGQLCLRCTAGGQRTALTLAGAPRTQLASSAQQDRASGLNAQRRHDMKTVASRSALASSNHSPLPAAGSRRCSSAALEGGDWACVIFDMGGTLFEHQTMLTRFAQHMIRQLTTAAGPEALEGFESSIGFNLQTGAIDPLGALASRPWNEIVTRLAMLLKRNNTVTLPQACAMVQSWRQELPQEAKPQALFDIGTLFHELRQRNIKIAVSTANDRAATERMLQEHRLDSLVNVIVAGDDDVPPKPHPDNARMIYSQLNVNPAKCIAVGDTKSDVMMARNARLGLSLGVLSGVSVVADLEQWADYIVPTAYSVLPLVRGDKAAFYAQAIVPAAQASAMDDSAAAAGMTLSPAPAPDAAPAVAAAATAERAAMAAKVTASAIASGGVRKPRRREDERDMSHVVSPAVVAGAV